MWPLVKDTCGDRDGGHHNVNLKFYYLVWKHDYTQQAQLNHQKKKMLLADIKLSSKNDWPSKSVVLSELFEGACKIQALSNAMAASSRKGMPGSIFVLKIVFAICTWIGLTSSFRCAGFIQSVLSLQLLTLVKIFWSQLFRRNPRNKFITTTWSLNEIVNLNQVF